VNLPGTRYTELSENLLHWADCVIIATHHSTYDDGWIVAHAQRVVDTRNATQDVKQHHEKVHKL
jgi:UDP-N-acetyl-D-glucosamine dehydrogenase